VLVNPGWLAHFGAGLVRTPSDFGARGEPPTHPELLDWLAAGFAGTSGSRFQVPGSRLKPWSFKSLHRLIMLSSTYQQSCQSPSAERDPENRLLGRMNRRRLDLEAFRDSLLLAGGRLDRAIGGPSLDLQQPSNRRRSVYALVDRQNLPGMLRLFDFANPDAHTSQRYVTTVPLQALFLLNSPFMDEVSRALAERSGDGAASDRLRRLYRSALGRDPRAGEQQRGLRFIEGGGSWAELAQALLLSNEFAFVD
jgi:hypothetical protein